MTSLKCWWLSMHIKLWYLVMFGFKMLIISTIITIICWVLSVYQVFWYIIHFHYFIKSSQCLMKEMWSYPLYRLGNWGFERLSLPGYLVSYGFNLGLSEFRAPCLHSTADLIVLCKELESEGEKHIVGGLINLHFPKLSVWSACCLYPTTGLIYLLEILSYSNLLG